MAGRPYISLFALALLVVLLNSLKPLHADDSDYFDYASQIVKAPLDPYGFDLKEGVPANYNLAPPGFLYWFAGNLKLFGYRPFLWKLALFPFALLLVTSLYQLLKRFAPATELPLVWMTALSPPFLPGWNLMLDLPALAISLGGLLLFFWACDRRSLALAMLAGLAMGLAMETKYTAFIAPAVALLYAVLFRRLPFAIVAGTMAVLVFSGWEAFIAARYGESHFLCSLHQRNGRLLSRITHLFPPLLSILGGAAPAMGLLGLIVLGRSRWELLGALVLACISYALLACIPDRYAILIRDPQSGKDRMNLNYLPFALSGLVVCVSAATVARELCRRGSGKGGDQAGWRVCPVDWFLALWLGLEVAGYFVLSPFPAVRRILGLYAVCTLIMGRLASQAGRVRMRPLYGVAAIGAVLGLGFYVIDLRDAFAERAVARATAREIRAQEPESTIWCYGLGGFRHYATQCGMKPMDTMGSRIQPGDWLVAADPCDRPVKPTLPKILASYESRAGARGVEEIAEIGVADWLPLRLMPRYYGESMPMAHNEGPRFVSTVYRFH
jgi:hypothetical protein